MSAKGNRIAIASNQGLLTVSNELTDWRFLKPPRVDIKDVTTDGSRIFMAAGWNVQVSNDGGGNWTSKRVNPDSNYYSCRRITLHENEVATRCEGKTNYTADKSLSSFTPHEFPFTALIHDMVYFDGLLHYISDKGFHKASVNHSTYEVVTPGKFYRVGKSVDTVIYRSSITGDMLSNKDKYKVACSPDGGKTVFGIPLGNDLANGASEVFGGSEGVYTIINNAALYRSKDCMVWQQIFVKEMSGDFLKSFTVSGKNLVIAGRNTLAVSKDDGAQWTLHKLDQQIISEVQDRMMIFGNRIFLAHPPKNENSYGYLYLLGGCGGHLM